MAAAGPAVSCPVLDWIKSSLDACAVHVHSEEGWCIGAVTVQNSFEAIQAAMLSWDVRDADALLAWLRGEGFRPRSVKAHFGARAQERVLSAAAAHDQQALQLERACVQLALAFGRRPASQAETGVRLGRRARRRALQGHFVSRPPGACSSFSAEIWSTLDDIDLREEFQFRVPCLQSTPAFLTGRIRYAIRLALTERKEACRQGNREREVQAWKLLGLFPSLLLRRPRSQGKLGRDELERRAELLAAGNWSTLLDERREAINVLARDRSHGSHARDTQLDSLSTQLDSLSTSGGSASKSCGNTIVDDTLTPTLRAFHPDHAAEEMSQAGVGAAETDWRTIDEEKQTSSLDATRRARNAEYKVRLNEISQARQALTSAPVAPRRTHTFDELQGKGPKDVIREIPANVRDCEGEDPLQLDRYLLIDCLKTAPRGSSGGPGGMAYEFFKFCLEDDSCIALLFDAAQNLGQAKTPTEISDAFTMLRLTALSKPTGGCRGIATGTSFRRLLARTLARQHALPNRAGMRPVPVRFFYESLDGLYRARDQGID